MILTLDETKKITKKLYELYDYNILNYDLAFVQRTLIKFSNQYNCKTYEALKELLLQDETLIHDFFDKLFINVSEMFRDPEVFKQIREKIIPYISSYPIIKIWSAGCARGQEVYSLAIMLKEAGIYDRCIIYATDIDSKAIDMATEGKYHIKDSFKYYENYYLSGGKEVFSKYFNITDKEIIIKEDLKNNICFSTHNIITDNIFNTFSLILCRNMFIYFDKDLQLRGLNTFKLSLEDNGFLVIGKSESINTNDKNSRFKDYDTLNKIYKLENT
jgi:chemotaxis protein methyltransferase CheR